MTRDLLIVLSIIASVILGVVSNFVADFFQFTIGKNKKLVSALFVGLLTLIISLTIVSSRPEILDAPPIPTIAINGEVLFYVNEKWIIKDLSNGLERTISLPQLGVNSVSWSPDGDRIIFGWSKTSTSQAGLYEYDLSQNEIKSILLLPDLELSDPVWSPDGSLIVFDVSPNLDTNAPKEIYSFNPQTNEVRRLTEKKEDARYPSWSPDSSKILYNARLNGVVRIFMMDRNGANKEEITAGMSENESYFNPHWSPNGEKIGAIHHYNNDTTSVVVIEVESRIESQVTKPYGLGNYSMPIWSTDNKWLAFHWNRDSNNPNYRGDYGDLYISDINGDALFRITQDNSTWWSLIAWRPD